MATNVEEMALIDNTRMSIIEIIYKYRHRCYKVVIGASSIREH